MSLNGLVVAMLRFIKYKNIPFLVYMFLYIFTPLVLLPFNVIHILCFVSFLYFLVDKKNSFSIVLASQEMRYFLIFHALLVMYCLIMLLRGATDFSPLYYVISTLIEIIPCALFISVILIKNKVNGTGVYNYLLLMGFLQFVFVALTIMFPNFRNMVMSSYGSQSLADVYNQVSLFRIFGLARGYTFSMPLFQGLCVILAICLGTYRSKKYFVLLPFYLLTILLNARIAMISFVIPPIIMMLNTRSINKSTIRHALLTIMLIVAMAGLFAYADYKAQTSTGLNTWKWIAMGNDDIKSFAEGNTTGSFVSLTDTMWFVPQGVVDNLFGTGENVFGRFYKSSDIGYVINLYYGGLFFSLLLYLSYILLIIKASGTSILTKTISFSILLYLLIANIKGNVFRPNEIINGVLLLSVYVITYKCFNHGKAYS